jgi:hypothetical protein
MDYKQVYNVIKDNLNDKGIIQIDSTELCNIIQRLANFYNSVGYKKMGYYPDFRATDCTLDNYLLVKNLFINKMIEKKENELKELKYWFEN